MAMPAPHNPHQNHLLDALPPAEYARIVHDIELIPLKLGEVDVALREAREVRARYSGTD